MKYDDNAGNLHIDFKKGLTNLDGYDSMKYIRYRDHILGDLGRIERQQKFLKSLIKRFFLVKTYFKIPELISIGLKYIDTNVSINMLLQVFNKLLKKGRSSVNFIKLPGESIYIEKISFYDINREKIKRENILKSFYE